MEVDRALKQEHCAALQSLLLGGHVRVGLEEV